MAEDSIYNFQPYWNNFKFYLDFLLNYWWLWLFIFCFILFFNSWMQYSRRRYWKAIPWILLEIKPPKDIERSPKNVESVFGGVWGFYGSISTKLDKYLKGVIQDYFSLEIVGLNGQIHFFIRIPSYFRNMVEAKIYAQYPKAEIEEAEDYVNDPPPGLLSKDWDLWGTVLKLAKPDPYPIRTYNQFIDIQSLQPFIDPMANLMEVLSKLKEGEQIWVQILCRPVADDWKDAGEALIDKLIGRARKKKIGLVREEAHGWVEAIRAVFHEMLWSKVEETAAGKKEEAGMPSLMQYLSPGEKEVVESVEKNLTKKGFQTKIQWVYFGRKDIFVKTTVGAIMGFFNQFAALDLNSFKLNRKYSTVGYYLFKERRRDLRKRVMLKLCRERSFWEKGYVFNTEELATIWHFPMIAVEAPMMPSVAARKGGPPPELPVI